ncbi:MAG: hypothetical protein NTV49_16305 [Kiritimatiellaeota bacterium]|nr:hypothetical protein [Kiritimatiellota bacterium]
MRSLSGAWKSLAWLVFLFTAVFLTGCASYRINATLKPTGAPVPGATQFNLTDVRYVVLTNVSESGLSPFPDYQMTGKGQFADLMAVVGSNLMAEAVAAYPKTFSTAPSALPLQVTITCVNNETAMNTAAICGSCITLTIVPLHSSDEKTYLVATRCGIESVNQRLAQPVTFKIKDVNWLSITPTGWIPVPADKGERVLGTDGAIKMVNDATLKACVEAVVGQLRRIQPEAWTPAPK